MASGSKTKATTTTNQTQTQTPSVPSWIQAPHQQYASQVSGFLNTPASSFINPSTSNQQQAWQLAGAGIDRSTFDEGVSATRGLLDWTPSQIGQVSSVNGGAANTIAGPNQSDYYASTVTPQMLSGIDMSPYTNPWENQVVSNALSDIDLQRQRAISGGQGTATLSGAFGGSRHGVADSLTNEAALRESGNTAAGLRAQGFLNAQDAARFDIGNRLGADTFNAGAQNQFRQGFLGDQMQTNLANQAAQEAATGRQFAADTNAQNLNQAGALANQNAGMQAQQMRAQAASALAQLGITDQQQQMAAIDQLSRLGAEERAVLAEQNPAMAELMRLLAAGGLLAGINGDMFTGQTVNTNGTTTGTTKESGGFLGGFGSVLSGLGALGIGFGKK